MKINKTMAKYSKFLLRLIDICIIILAYILVQVFKYEGHIKFNQNITEITINTIILAVFVYQIFFALFDLYKNITKYEGGRDYLKYGFTAIISATIISIIGNFQSSKVLGVKFNLLASMFILTSMITYRVIIRLALNNELISPKVTETSKNLLIIGAGEATKDIIKTLKKSTQTTYNIVGIIDDNPSKIGSAISGIKILGNRDKIIEVCKQYNVQVIFFSISKIRMADRKEILNICQHTGAKLRILPSTADLIRNRRLLDNLRDVEIDDLLGRDPIKLDNSSIAGLIKEKVVLVTGGGGSIGSELCRQIMKFSPERLVIFDIYENNLYNIELELKALYPDAKIDAIIGSVRDITRLEEVFSTYKPYLVFHAAAHKHVPLMEVSPLEAIHNNVFGTYNVVNCADKYSAKRFVLISTDKAVNPTNIMGATKRLCEMIVQAKNKVSNTEFAAVRFGNVLGSNGSVVPLFRKQIAKGGPVTVTHKDITRFFMTIPEATQLVIQAASNAQGGEIFVLDMGQPVKIYDLAVSLIKLSGLEPDVDIPIQITGLRPGEKLYEELLMSEEGLTSTKHNKIFVAKPSSITMSELNYKLDLLNEIQYGENYSTNAIKEIIKKVVPTYKEPEEVNKLAEDKKDGKANIAPKAKEVVLVGKKFNCQGTQN